MLLHIAYQQQNTIPHSAIIRCKLLLHIVKQHLVNYTTKYNSTLSIIPQCIAIHYKLILINI